MNEEYLSLYDFLGKPAGSDLGKQVAAAASAKKIKINERQVTTNTYSGKILTYPKSFLVEYFKPIPVASL
jgi:hypothetical protein